MKHRILNIPSSSEDFCQYIPRSDNEIESVAILLAANLDASNKQWCWLTHREKGQHQAKLQHVKMKSLKSASKDT